MSNIKDVVIVGAVRTPVGKHGGMLRNFDAVALSQIAAELGWNSDKVNVKGGAVALGHPVGSSGCRIVVTLVHEMKRRNKDGVLAKYGLATLCAGGGQGSALIVKAPN